MAPKHLTLAAAAASLVTSAYATAYAPWDALNITLGGRLHKSVPLEQPCFAWYNGRPTAGDSEACDAIRANYTLNTLRIGTAESYMSMQNQMCISDPADQCVLSNAQKPAPLPPANSTCGQGSVPSYHIQVESADDVVAAFAFAKENGVEISVKNSGHDFMIRSSGKGTLNLWTHNLQGMTYHVDFIPQGANASVGAAMTVAAGVQVGDAYNFADDNGALILGPYAPSVAMSAGWVTGGGHSVFSPVYGLGADRVVEFSIVTPDGVKRTANAQQNPDLFWALRGGGGGTFGVILSATHRVEPRAPVAYADIHLPSNITTEDALEWVELLLEDSLAWGEAGWGGHVGGTFVTHFNPLPALTADNGTAARAAFQRASDFALRLGGTSNILVAPSFTDIYNKYNVPANTNNGGGFTIVSSRLMPRSKIETQEGRDSVIAYMREAMALGFDPRSMYTPVTTPFVYKGAEARRSENSKSCQYGPHGTSLTQTWYDAVWHFETSGRLAVTATYAQRLEFMTNITTVSVKAAELMGPGSGAYQNEANPFAPQWQEAFWGASNYAKLLRIKNKYDPSRLLKCWKCVGFDEQEDVKLERFACNAKMQSDVIKALS
ncbi:FAD-binding domain-containing protein [Thozetella sp. PMI_491]|nr:FAD-binding domain-containing protein [Thozetella sp. PMI_491]